MSTMKRFTSYASVGQGQAVYLRWPSEALPVPGARMPWRKGKVTSVGEKSVAVKLDGSGSIICCNLKALHRLVD